ncbi:MAG: di-heme oxidoredictase family protein [Planctomycetota bacterium]
MTKRAPILWLLAAVPLLGFVAPASADGEKASEDARPIVPLHDASTALEPDVQESTEAALITRLADRARDRHAREDQFGSYDHYLSRYWEHRTAAIEIVDEVARGGDTITFHVATRWPLSPTEAELRFFYRGINTVAEYHDNGVMKRVPERDVEGDPARHYVRSVRFNPKTRAPLRVGDRLEFELSQFLSDVPAGRNNYYGTATLYVVGEGVVPWEARGTFGDPESEREDSFPLQIEAWLGGRTTLPYQYSDEPGGHFQQMAGNLSPTNGQAFVRGRRVHHTDFGDGAHDEGGENPAFDELAEALGPRYVNRSCAACHERNGRAVPPPVGGSLERYVVRVGGAAGAPHPDLGSVLQSRATEGAPEGTARLAGWTAVGDLRAPTFAFTGPEPQHFSARIAPQLVGMGLLEAIRESDVEALADPDDTDGDGISGRVRIVRDVESGEPRLGRFGWKAAEARVAHQVAAALDTDMGVRTSLRPRPDRGSAQEDTDAAGVELDDARLRDLTAYVSLLGVSARRDLHDPATLAGEALFTEIGCAACHVPTFRTSPFHPHAELRDQTIHPYTDLLLHDMGPGLASSLVEGDAAPAEWRTPPLWSIGLTARVSGAEAYLHDGRARSLEEAILWHGGEGEAARDAYRSRTDEERAAVLAFLRSL